MTGPIRRPGTRPPTSGSYRPKAAQGRNLETRQKGVKHSEK